MTSNTRKLYYPNPLPNEFYSGNTEEEPFVGLRENYYAWEWGNALFVVLDPFWYTVKKTDWGWTLGQEQYNWFKNVTDQIALSVRGNSEVWIIDHSTITAEAKEHTGGMRGKGGDLLYHWGNPACYGAGNGSNQRYFEQHDVEWVRPGNPGEGNLTCFNNRLGRGNYSTVDEFTPAVNVDGSYSVVTGSAFAPAIFTWTYQGDATNPLYSENISGAYRLPNGNTLICSGTIGRFLEVTSDKDIVWEYICPVEKTGVITQGNLPAEDPARADETMNSVFRIYKYPVDYGAFTGRDLTPGDFIELYPTGINEQSTIKSVKVYPNPFTNQINLPNATGHEFYMLMNATGKTVWSGTYIEKQDFTSLLKGVYLLKVRTGDFVQTIKILK